MLYLTTKNKANSYTAYRMLRCTGADDGGMFMPMAVPLQDDIALAAFEQMRFGQTAATILNLFFGTRLTGWDVDFAVGRQAVNLAAPGSKLFVAESWHNPSGTQDYLTLRLYELVTGEKDTGPGPNPWFQTVVNIAILFGVYGKLCRNEIYSFDVAVETGDLQMLLAVRYAQKMGLPIGKIILGCIEGDSMWDFISYGDYGPVKKTRRIYLEALLWLEFGYDEVANYLASIEKRSIYRLKPMALEMFRKDLFPTVVGDRRSKNVAESAMRTVGYSLAPDTARAYGALQDYRAKTGENRNTLLVSGREPVKHKK